MNRISKLPLEVDLIGQIADLKEVNYKNTLMITAIVEVLVEKQIVTRREILDRAEKLDHEFYFDPEQGQYS